MIDNNSPFPIINVLDCKDIDSIIDITYEEFKRNHMNEKKRPKKFAKKPF